MDVSSKFSGIQLMIENTYTENHVFNKHKKGVNMTKQELPDYSQFQKLVTDPDFIKLRQLTSKFNIFEVMRATHTEIRHSNILAWLLDPNKNHGCGDAFLRQLLLTVSQKKGLHGLSFYDFYMLDVERVIIHREWSGNDNTVNEDLNDQDECAGNDRGRIDILIILKLKNELKVTRDENKQKPSNKEESYTSIVIPIENKILSKESTKESGTQLERYSKKLHDKFKDKTMIIPLFLTPSGVNPTDPEWIKVDYHEIKNIISIVYEHHKADLAPGKCLLIEQYLDLLDSYVISGSDPGIVKLCRIIQANHHSALDIIRRQITETKSTDADLNALTSSIYDRNESAFKAYFNWLFELRRKISHVLSDWMEENRKSLGITIKQNKKKTSLDFVSHEMININRHLFGEESGFDFYFSNNLNCDLKIIFIINETNRELHKLRQDVSDKMKRDNPILFNSSTRSNVTERHTGLHRTSIISPDEAFDLDRDTDVLDTIKIELDKYFSPNGTYMQIQKYLQDNMSEFLSLK